MDALTANELKVLNNLSNLRDTEVDLGTLMQSLVDSVGSVGTPVNAVSATSVLTLTGVVVDGQTVTIDNPAVAGSDVYEFLADTLQTKTNPSNIGVNITANTTKATVNLTLPTQPTAGDTMTLGTKTYIFVPAGTNNADGEISIGSNLANAQTNIVAAINGTDGVNVAHSLVSAGAFATNVSAITAFVGGTAGNSIASTETFVAVGNVFSGATLSTGADCTAANAITALVTAVTASDTQGVGAADGAGDTVDFTADVAGVVGNAITLAETMTNGSFAAGTMAGGVDGTVGVAGKVMVDSSYLYVAIAANTTAGKNWRRISVGAAY